MYTVIPGSGGDELAVNTATVALRGLEGIASFSALGLP